MRSVRRFDFMDTAQTGKKGDKDRRRKKVKKRKKRTLYQVSEQIAMLTNIGLSNWRRLTCQVQLGSFRS